MTRLTGMQPIRAPEASLERPRVFGCLRGSRAGLWRTSWGATACTRAVPVPTGRAAWNPLNYRV